MDSFKFIAKQRLKSMFINIRSQNPNVKTFILVLDQKTIKIVSSFLKMSELLELGIAAVENLQLKRKPFQIDAIYFIAPVIESLELIIEDFKEEAQYKNIHIYFNDKIQQILINKLQKEQNVMQRVVACKSFNFDFICPQDNVFSLQFPNPLNLFKGKMPLVDVAERLATVLVSFDKFYSFEIIFRQDQWQYCIRTAQFLQQRMRELLDALQKNNSTQYDLKDKACGKIRIVITDRSLDPVSPLLHDFYYQPMFYDLLDIENDMYTYQITQQNQVNEKKALLNDDDEMFKKYKYRHIAEVLEGVATDFQSFMKSNEAAKANKEQNLNLQQMNEIVRKMPQYQELVQKYTMHMEIVEKSFDTFAQKELSEVGDIEQTLATGIDKKGGTIAATKILQRVLSVIQNKYLSQTDKLRLILVSIIQIDLAEKDRKTLTDLITLDQQQAILNLRFLGITAQKSGGKSHKRVNEQVKKYAKTKMATEALELCRNTPIYEQILEEMVMSDFKQLPQGFERFAINDDAKNPTQGKSLRQKGQLARLMQDGNDNDEKDKIVFFSLGGLGYNEIRSLISNQKIRQNHQVLVGGTSLLKPEEFVKELINLNQI
ncbi:hypothetical protein pb186bvf_001121 [Paramecium bursaria]